MLVSHRVVPQLWLSRACPGGSSAFSPRSTFPRLAWLLPLAWECCWVCGVGLTKKLLMELFPLQLKLITYFSLFPLGSAVGSFARVLQGTGMACTGAWNHSRVGMHCPEPASF